MPLKLLIALLLSLTLHAQAQRPALRTPADFGFRQLAVRFGRDTAQVLVQSPPGQEHARLPVLLWAQGSLPKPVIMYDSGGPYQVFPFVPRPARLACHLVIIGKPGIPLVADTRQLDQHKCFVDKVTRAPPLAYCQRNYLGYYVARAAAVVRYLQRQPWVDAHRVVVAGHSEGSEIAARPARQPRLVSRAVYLSGSPLGRELTIVTRERLAADTTGARAEVAFAEWQRVVAHPQQNDCGPGDSNLNSFSHGQSELPHLLGARVPVFVGYGTLDAGAAANDYLRLEAIRQGKTHLTFRAYAGREHNFFRVSPSGQPDYDTWYWDRVGAEFLRWAGLLAS